MHLLVLPIFIFILFNIIYLLFCPHFNCSLHLSLVLYHSQLLHLFTFITAPAPAMHILQRSHQTSSRHYMTKRLLRVRHVISRAKPQNQMSQSSGLNVDLRLYLVYATSSSSVATPVFYTSNQRLSKIMPNTCASSLAVAIRPALC